MACTWQHSSSLTHYESRSWELSFLLNWCRPVLRWLFLCVAFYGMLQAWTCLEFPALKGKGRKGKERKGKERKGKERKGKERKELLTGVSTCLLIDLFYQNLQILTFDFDYLNFATMPINMNSYFRLLRPWHCAKQIFTKFLSACERGKCITITNFKS